MVKQVVKQVVKVAPPKNYSVHKNYSVDYTEETLRFAAKGLSKKQGGLNKGDVKLAVLELSTKAFETDKYRGHNLLSVVNDVPGDVLREMLKKLLGRCDPMGKLPCILPDPPKHLLYALGSVSEQDQQTIVDRAPHTMVYHNSRLDPLSVAGNSLSRKSLSIQEIEQNFEPIKYFADGHAEHEHIGLTQKEYDTFDGSWAKRGKVTALSRFVLNYDKSGRAKCYITGNKIAKGTLRISFGTPQALANERGPLFGNNTRVITSHGDALEVLKALGGRVSTLPATLSLDTVDGDDDALTLLHGAAGAGDAAAYSLSLSLCKFCAGLCS